MTTTTEVTSEARSQAARGQVQDRFKVLIVASLRYPIAEPFAGGLEAHTVALARGLRARGHSVTVAGAAGSDPELVSHVFGALPRSGTGERADIMENPAVQAAEHRGFADLADDLRSGLIGSFDLVHNNSLYPLLVEQAGSLPCPLITTLHTPPLPWAGRVLRTGAHPGAHFIAVSRSTARSWSSLLHPRVVLNGIDLNQWEPGPGGRDAVWSGRLVAEKAPHLAIQIAKAAGCRLTIAGPIIDQSYFASAVAPLLDDRIRYAGHLNQRQLAALVGSSAVALVTPTWDEPFGMVVAEAMSCGTPVLAFARGGIPELLTRDAGRLLAGPTGKQLSAAEIVSAVTALTEARNLDRAIVRQQAELLCSDSAMLSGYEHVYQDALLTWELQ